MISNRSNYNYNYNYKLNYNYKHNYIFILNCSCIKFVLNAVCTETEGFPQRKVDNPVENSET